MKKRFSIFLAWFLLCAFLAIPAQAAEGYLPMEKAAQEMREHLENRDTVFSINLRTQEADEDQAFLDLLHEAVAHTGVPTQGDYIWWQMGAGEYTTTVSEKRNEKLYAYFVEMEYYTSAEQEAELNEKYCQVMESLSLDGKTDIEKVRAIYDYITANVVYDYENLEDDTYNLKYTAYAAMVQGTAVCQGYANLFYRMANDAGLDCRLVIGDGGGGLHSWNIVRLGDVYYYLDATWDEGKTEYTYFLKCEENFPMHALDYEYTVDPFFSEYPMSAVDYTEVCDHSFTEEIIPATCTEDGYTLYTCICGSRYTDNVTDALGHTYEGDYCTTCGLQPAISGTCGENVTWRLEDNGTLTISGTGPMADYDDLPGKPYAPSPYSVERIVVEEGVTEIGDYAFAGFRALESIDLPESLRSIGAYAFAGCSMDAVFLPDGVIHIGEAAFSACDYLTCAIIPDSVSVIEDFAFTDCYQLSYVKIPDGLTVMGDYAFSDCDALTEVTIPNNGAEYESGVFFASGVETVIIEKGVTKIGDQIFAGCDNLTSVTIPNTVTHIGDGAFSQCESLEYVILPNGVTTIGDYAFAHCYGLTEIMIPASVTFIDEKAFYNCYNIAEIHFKGDAPEAALDSFLYVMAAAYYPMGNATWIDYIIQGVGGFTLWLPENRTCYHLTTQTIYAEEATCFSQGYTGDLICTGCGEVTQLGEVTPITDHNYVDGWCIYCSEADPNWEPPKNVDRLAGAHRYETAFLAANRMKENLYIEKFDTVVVASGTDFADALSGSYLAAVNQAPILLACDVEWINDLTKDYIRENLNPGGTVYILGGTKAIPESFQEGLESFTVDRLAGNNRFDTNLLVLAEAGVEDQPILVCTGIGFADSLSASAAQMPILLVYKDDLLDGQTVFMRSVKDQDLYVIGGEGAVSQKLEEQLETYGTVERIAGGNRFETSVRIAEQFFGYTENAVLAYAWDFPDGLCGGPLAATMNAPLILTMEKYEQQAASYIQDNAIYDGIILGGEKLIPQTSVNTIFDIK